MAYKIIYYFLFIKYNTSELNILYNLYKITIIYFEKIKKKKKKKKSTIKILKFILFYIYIIYFPIKELDISIIEFFLSTI